jgi:putative transposase
MARAAYPTDLTDAQWKRLEELMPAAKSGGRSRTTDLREVLNATLYIVRGGMAWRLMPHDFPPWSTVYHYFRCFRKEGRWQTIHDALRDKVRSQAGRETSPSAAIMDSQSVKTTEKKGFEDMTRARK